MAFIDTRLPDGIGYGCEFGPAFSTDCVAVDSGQEARNQRWSASKLRANIGFVNRTLAETIELDTFFRAVAKGKLNSFRVKDARDYSATVATGRAISIASSPATRFQLVKRYTVAGQLEDRYITKPVSGTMSIYVSEVLKSSPADYTLDLSTGILVFTLAQSASNITWAGQFDIEARFDTDEMPVSIVDRNAYSWGSIPIVEIRAS